MKKTAVFIAGGTGMGADAAKTFIVKKGYNIAIIIPSGKGEELARENWVVLVLLAQT